LAYEGKTFCLYGDSGSGKTTQGGELAKHVWKTRKKKAVLNTADRGGYESVKPLEKLGLLSPNELGPDDDPWIWIDDAISGKNCSDDVGLAIFDSGTSFAEQLLSACSHADFQIGQQRTQRFAVSKGTRSLNVSINNEAHYGVVQGFLLGRHLEIHMAYRRGIDVLWTFRVHRGEEQDRTPILGPKLAGKALTAAIPKWFKYTFRVASIPQDSAEPIHRLYLTEYPELAGLGHSFGNSRQPLGVEPLPPYIEPASLPTALELLSKSQEEAEQLLKDELGL
jgi:hypothetical protein